MKNPQPERRGPQRTLPEVNAEVESLFTENKKLHSYVKKLGGNADFGNNGKTLSEVGERHQRRKLKELKTIVEKALWFTDTFGLSLTYFLRKGLHKPHAFPRKILEKFLNDLSKEEHKTEQELLVQQQGHNLILMQS